MRGFFDLKNPTHLPDFFIHSSVHGRKNDLKIHRPSFLITKALIKEKPIIE
jgi:hypothetical protein